MVCGFAVWYSVYVCACEVCDEHVALDGCFGGVECYPVVFHAGFGCGCGDESGVVGVVVVDVYEGVDAALDEVCEEELHVSGFVSAESEACGVVAFDEEWRDVGDVGVHGLCDGGAEVGHLLEGRVFAREGDAGEVVDGVEDLVGVHVGETGMGRIVKDFKDGFGCLDHTVIRRSSFEAAASSGYRASMTIAISNGDLRVWRQGSLL